MNILLIEPDYKNKYPPLGLMKISYYHKMLRGDFVWFSKGELANTISQNVVNKMNESKFYSSYKNIKSLILKTENIIKNKKWDRVYVTTLFTFEWDITIEAINYAKSLVDDTNKVFVGGILATLMPGEVFKETGIKPICGLLENSSSLGLDDNICIDTLTPDYSMIDNTDYDYPMSDGYFTRYTRGCGMNCSFCAVKTLEPKFREFISIKSEIEKIDELYGKKKNLYLMDNNILRSRYLNDIVDELIELGFYKGATIKNTKTCKQNLRYVDFNQGLDMNFFNERTAKLLSKLAVKPLRIAFDHIDDKEKYLKSIKLAESVGITSISNYLLFNASDFSGKGKLHKADTPADMYERIKINVDFVTEVNNKRRKQGQKLVDLYSFPMRFMPLKSKNRSFYGGNWSKKQLTNFLKLTSLKLGVVPAKEKFFYDLFGKDVDEFEMRMQMPSRYMYYILDPLCSYIPENRKNIKKQQNHNIMMLAVKEWERLYYIMSYEEKNHLINMISNNKYNIEDFLNLNSKNLEKIYIHYFWGINLILFINKIRNNNIEKFEHISSYLLDGNSGGKLLKSNMYHLSNIKNKKYVDSFIKCLMNSHTQLSFDDIN